MTVTIIKTTQPYKIKFLLVFMLLTLLPRPLIGGNYPLGTLTCEDMGDFAAEALMWRKRGMTPAEALKKLDERHFNDPVERPNLLDVLKLVYGGYGTNWTEENAKKAIKQDCERGRE